MYVVMQLWRVHFAGGMRKSSPLIVGALFVIIAALACTIIGNSRGSNKTLVGAVLYILGGNSALHTRR